MLKAEQVPDEIARLADEAYYDTAGDNPTMSDEDIMKYAIAAAINAWPGVGIAAIPHWPGPHQEIEQRPSIILPLTEPRDE